MSVQNENERRIVQSLQEYLRGVVGGLLFSLPLLYTMEVWWTGFIAEPLRLLIYLLVTFTLLLGYNRYAGLRRDASPVEVAIDSVEEMGLGLLLAAFFLWLIGQITNEMPLSEIIGKIIIESMAVAIGVSVGTAQLGGAQGKDKDDVGMKGDESPSCPMIIKEGGNFEAQLTVALCGAVLFGANVAPTEEIVLIAIETSSAKLLGLGIVSIVLAALILFYSNFQNSPELTQRYPVRTIVFGTVVTYAIALLVSAALLWFFKRFEDTSLITCLSETVVLGVAATLGASAGRLLIE